MNMALGGGTGHIYHNNGGCNNNNNDNSSVDTIEEGSTSVTPSKEDKECIKEADGGTNGENINNCISININNGGLSLVRIPFLGLIPEAALV
ncbi:hypothetical protein BGZ58_007075 [Dissophora ornata]|nr:hypothetical protein BGZ58_007075 [Dissophora ornata]